MGRQRKVVQGGARSTPAPARPARVRPDAQASPINHGPTNPDGLLRDAAAVVRRCGESESRPSIREQGVRKQPAACACRCQSDLWVAIAQCFALNYVLCTELCAPTPFFPPVILPETSWSAPAAASSLVSWHWRQQRGDEELRQAACSARQLRYSVHCANLQCDRTVS